MIATFILAALATAQADAPQAAPPAPAQPRTICRNVQDTGSRLRSRRVCRTVGGQADRVAEQEARDTQAQVAEEAERARDNNGQNALGSTTPN